MSQSEFEVCEWSWRITTRTWQVLLEGTVPGPVPVDVEDADTVALAVLSRTSAAGLVATAWPTAQPALCGFAVSGTADDADEGDPLELRLVGVL